ncbi:MAG TPA: TetR/AcrR family transcriptional regulator [candidate division Zixibacteria bacterium]|nr:TetR/AcrR family transcriptional regulator [candidate division Zixibacteria bacterium]
MAPRTADKESKRLQILSAALQVVARKGMHGFKMIEIAEQAGVGKGTLYEYFPSKEKMLSGVFEMFFAEFLEYIGKRMAGIEDPAEKIRRYVVYSIEFLCEREDLVDGLFDFYAGGIPRKNGASPLFEMTDAYRKAIADLAGIIEKGIARKVFRPVDARFFAAMILATIDGLWFQMALRVTPMKKGINGPRLADMILSGLSNRAARSKKKSSRTREIKQ